jgi:RNA polymerase sigma factor (sigma-70 family)
VEDREIVAAIVAGDPAGLAEAYDRYAAALYTYCRTMLRGSADASDAVQDTFIIASTKLAQLRDPAKLRTWLYAVARNECYRRLRGKEITPGLDEVPDVTDESTTVGAEAERTELRQLVHDALIGMNTGDREVIELMIRHDFEGNELSEALGVSRNHAHAMLSRARNQLKTSLGALLVARTGRGSCAVLADMLAHWDGTMSILMRKQVNRHIENCEVCEDRRRRELAPAALFSLLPVVAAVPPGLREHVLRLCSDDSPLSVRYRQRVIKHADSFRPDGFPSAPAIPMSARLRAARRGTLLAIPAALALIVAVVVIAALAATGSSPTTPLAGRGITPGPAIAPSPASASAPSLSVAPTSAIPASSHPPTHRAAHSRPPLDAGTSPSQGVATTPASTAPVSTAPASVPPHAPSPRPSPTPSHTTRSPSPSPAPAQGTLTTSVSGVTLTAAGGQATGSFILTAAGGPVRDFSIIVPAGASGLLTVSPTSGELGAGRSVLVTLTLTRLIAFDQTLVIDPGGLSVTVTYTPPKPVHSKAPPVGNRGKPTYM